MVKEIQIDVESKQLALIKKILKRHITYKAVWAYGSRVNWTANQYSDLDLVVFEVNAVKLGELKEDFAESDLPFTVDVMSWEKIPEKFKNKILKNYVVLQGKPELEDWKECKLGDAITLQRGHDLPKSKMMNGSIPVAGSNGIIGYHNKATTNAPGITIGRSGNLGNAYFYKEDFWAHNTTLYVKDFKSNNELFIYYFLKTFDFKLFNVGSAVPTLNRNHIHPLDVIIPPLPEQKSIASVLSSLDDKIDLLHRQNKTLETMAETLFRQWFVKEAKEDWVDGQLGDVLELVYGKGLKEEIRTGKGYPVVGSNGVVGYHSDSLVDGPGIVIGRKGTLGKVIYIFENFSPIDTTYYIKSKVNSTGLFYEYFLLKSLNFEDMNSDSAVPGLNRDIALSTEIKIAPFDKLEEFNQYSSTFLEKLNSNNIQTRTLEKLRDMLLTKLISGEVRVGHNNERK